MIEAIKQGKVIVCPTDTVYGLIADATNKKAVERIFKIKKRIPEKPMPIFVKSIRAAKKLAQMSKKQEDFLRKSWPGKVTVVLKRRGGTKIFGIDKKTIGLRIPKYKIINILLEKTDKSLVGTSANISGKPASTKIKEVLKQFENQKHQPDLVADLGDLPKNLPSTIIDLTGKSPRLLRKGTIKI